MGTNSGPVHVAAAISDLFQLKGYARRGGRSQLRAAWKAVVGEELASRTQPLGVQRGTLTVEVAGSALLGEMVSFRQHEILGQLKTNYPQLRIRSIKFRLNSHVGEKKS